MSDVTRSDGVAWQRGKRGESQPVKHYGGDRLIPAWIVREGKTMTDTTRSTDHGAEARKHLAVAAREVSLEMAGAAQAAAQTHALLEVADKINEVRWALAAVVVTVGASGFALWLALVAP